jgi:hypothetical protein
MQMTFIIVLLAGIVSLLAAGDKISLSLSGDVYGTTYQTQYNVGLIPTYHKQFGEARELSVGIPIRFWGNYIGAGNPNYKIRTTYTTLGFDGSYFWKVFAWKNLSVLFGPEIYLNYALPPKTVSTIDGSTSTRKDDDYVIGSAGLCAPVAIDVFLNRHFGLRLTERLIRINADALIDDRISADNHAAFHAGIEPVLTPDISVLFQF